MKEIKTANYIKKEALWSLPGDRNLPPGVTDREISERGEGVEEDIASNQQGSSELDYYKIYYKYNYYYNNNEVTKIIPLKAISYMSKDIETRPTELNILVEENKEQIIDDIEHFEEDSKIERNQDYNPFE